MNLDLSNRGVQWFDAASTRNLSDVGFATVDLSNNGVRTLRNMTVLNGLTTLNLSHNMLTTLPPLPLTISCLLVSDNKLRVGWDADCQLQRLSSLEVVDVSRNALPALPLVPTSVRRLIAAGNRISNFAGVSPKICVLDVAGNPIRPGALASLPQSLRHLKITWDGIHRELERLVLDLVPGIVTINEAPIAARPQRVHTDFNRRFEPNSHREDSDDESLELESLRRRMRSIDATLQHEMQNCATLRQRASVLRASSKALGQRADEVAHDLARILADEKLWLDRREAVAATLRDADARFLIEHSRRN